MAENRKSTGKSQNINEVNQANDKFNKHANISTTPAAIDHSTKQDDSRLPPAFRDTKTTMLPIHLSDKDIAFQWENVGHYKVNHNKKQAQFKKVTHKQSSKVEAYIMDHFYQDWYWNCSLVIGTCFFSWLFARLGWGIFGLGFVFLCTNSSYRSEFRRFNRNIRDDITRIVSTDRLETQLETMEWMNSFLAKFWVIYMPALSETVMIQAKQVLDGAAPGYGIDALSLDQFTLGSKAPTINSVKSYTRRGKDHIEMDWNFSFTPNDTGDMTKNELKKKINPKVALGVRVGKGIVSKHLPILVEDMSFTGLMNIKMKLSNNFPHIKMVSVSFLEPPTIDYALKPVGGDTFGLDIMSLIPGLSSFVNSLIHSNLRPMLYAPNSYDIDVEDLMAQQSNDSIGVVALTVKQCKDLKPIETSKKTADPYITITVDNNAEIHEKTSVKSNSNSPVWNETKYILVNSLEQNLNLNVYDFNGNAKDSMIGKTQFHLQDLLQEEIHLDKTHNITSGDRTRGKVHYDLRYFPVVQPKILEDGTKETTQDSNVGILKFTLQNGKNFDLSESLIGVLNPYAKIYINDKFIKKTRSLKRVNEPVWAETFETLITDQGETKVHIQIYDNVGLGEDPMVGEFRGNLQDIIFQVSQGHDWFNCLNQGQLRISAQWKAVGLTGISSKTQYTPSIGTLRLHLRNAEGLKNLEAVGKVDPYIRVLVNGKLKNKTLVHPKTMSPEFEEVFFIPIANEHQHISLEVMDMENIGKDRSLGSIVMPITDYLRKNNENYYLAYDGSEKIDRKPVIYKNKEKGFLNYSISFMPMIPVYTKSELEELDIKREKEAIEKKKEEEEQLKMDKLFKEHPHEYEWVEEEKVVNIVPEKQVVPFEKLLQYKSGNLIIHILDGELSKPDCFIHFLFDDLSFSSFISSKAQGRKLGYAETGEGFIRDLPNSNIIIRMSKKEFITDEDQIICEKSFPTIALLKQSFDVPVELKIDTSVLKLQFEFIPTAVVLNDSDTVLDVGHVKLDILDANDLMASDRNGKSDPYAVITYNGTKIYKSHKVKKTLSPIWNEEVEFPVSSRTRSKIYVEIWDWDLADEDDFLGKAAIDLASIEPFTPTDFQVNLDSQGTVRLRATFKPEYVRPKIGSEGGFMFDIGSVGGAPMKLVGGAASFAGSGLGALGGGVSRGGSLFKSVVKRNGKKHNNDNESLYTNDEGSPAPSSPQSKQGTYSNDLQSLRSGQVNNNYLVPEPQHRRVTSDVSDMSSFMGSTHTSDAIPGKVTIVSGSGFVPTQVQVKITLASNSRGKDLYKTRALKSSDRFFKWNETVPFKATPDTVAIFQIREHHTFGKSSQIGEAKVQLSEVIGNFDDTLVDIGGKGSLIVNFKYGEATDAPVHTGQEVPPHSNRNVNGNGVSIPADIDSRVNPNVNQPSGPIEN